MNGPITSAGGIPSAIPTTTTSSRSSSSSSSNSSSSSSNNTSRQELSRLITAAVGDEEKASLLLLDEKKLLSDIESDAADHTEIESRLFFSSFFSSFSSSRGRQGGGDGGGARLPSLTSSYLATAATLASGIRSLTWWRAAVTRSCVFLLPSVVVPLLPRHTRFTNHHHSRRRQSSLNGLGIGGGGSGGGDCGGGGGGAAGSSALGPTAYLDGMRGVAAFSVFFCHYFYTCFRIAEGYGFGEDNFYFLKLPFVRLWYQGPPMVCVFFVISGYALSLKPLKLARAMAASAAAAAQQETSTSPSSSRSSSSSTTSDNHNNNNNAAAAFSTTMSSFVFRRFLRLFLPTAASTLLIVVLLRLGAYEQTRSFAHDAAYMRNVQETHPERLATMGEQLADWAWAMFEFVHVWDWRQFGGSTAYDVHLWTIPVEFRCSMVLFLTLVSAARLRTAARLAVFAAVALFCYRSDRWEMLLFYGGAVLAELDLVRGAHTDPDTCAAVEGAQRMQLQLLLPTTATTSAGGVGVGVGVGPMRMGDSPPSLLLLGSFSPHAHTHARSASTSSTLSSLFKHSSPVSSIGSNDADMQYHQQQRRSRRHRSGYKLFWGLTSILALYLMCQPDVGAESTPGWVFLSSLVPAWWSDKYRYWQTAGSVLFVAAVARLPRWQRVFNTRPVQYLGRISYAVYLMHGPVLHTVGYAIERRAWAITGAETEARYVAGFALAGVLVVPAVVWAADVFWRAVDAPVVRFAKRLEAKCSIPG